NRLLDLHSEVTHQVAVTLPAGEQLYVRTYTRQEAPLKMTPGATVSCASLKLGASAAAKGSIDASHERGLFAAAYGPSYYRGFVDKNDELQSVPLKSTGVVLYTEPRKS